MPLPGNGAQGWDAALTTWLETAHGTDGMPKLLADVTLGGDAASLDLPGLDLSAWRLVRLVAVLRGTTAVGGSGTDDWERAILRFNGDTGANYLWNVINGDATNVNEGSPGYLNGIEFGHMPGPTQAASRFSANVADIVLPADTAKSKTVLTAAGFVMGGVGLSTSGMATWDSAAAITRATVVANDGRNLVAGSRAFIVGLA